MELKRIQALFFTICGEGRQEEADPEPLLLPSLGKSGKGLPLEHAYSYATTISTSDDEEEPEELVDEVACPPLHVQEVYIECSKCLDIAV